MSYKHLSLEERHYIDIELKNDSSINKIAKYLKRSHSTISREIERNTGLRGYRYKQANRKAQERHDVKAKSIKLTDEIKELIDQGLDDDWSPEQIVGRLKINEIISLHHETVYQYVLSDKRAGGDLYLKLRHQGKSYRKRYGTYGNRTGIPNRIDIDERPEAANDRTRTGDWEADTIIGKGHKGAIVTLDERVTKIRLAAPLSGKHAEDVKHSIIELLSPIDQHVKTITFDNGKEFTQHEEIAKGLSCDTYFAKPYHSWERGQNENANGLLRQYFPKSMALSEVDMDEVIIAVDKLNSRPRKCLGYQTPYESFEENTGIELRNLLGYALIT